MMNTPRPWINAFKTILVIPGLLALALVACQLVQPSISTPPPETPSVAPATEVPASPTLEVPIHAKGASQLGSLEFVLVYEPSLLEVVEVKRGPLASNALLEFHNGTPGRLWTGIVDANGITGEGPLAIISFRPIAMSPAPSPLVLESVSAYSASTLLDMPVQPSSGEFTIQGQKITSPEVAFTSAQ